MRTPTTGRGGGRRLELGLRRGTLGKGDAKISGGEHAMPCYMLQATSGRMAIEMEEGVMPIQEEPRMSVMRWPRVVLAVLTVLAVMGLAGFT